MDSTWPEGTKETVVIIKRSGAMPQAFGRCELVEEDDENS